MIYSPNVLQMAGGGSNASADQDVATTSALPPAPANGQRVWVRSVMDEFVWVTGSTATADAITVITGTGGRWFRMTGMGNPLWRAQKAWYINDTLGNDENAGSATGAGALKTPGELSRRIGYGQSMNGGGGVAAPVIITIESNVSDTNAFVISWGFAIDTHLRVVGGVAATIGTGTITAVTAKNRGTNVPNDLEDTVLGTSWTASGFVATTASQRLRITTVGTNQNAVCYTLKDLTAKKCRISQLASTTASTFSSTLTQRTPTTEAYAVETLWVVHIGRLELFNNHANAATNVVTNVNFEQLEIRETNTTASLEIQCPQTMNVNFYECIFRCRVNFARHNGNVFNCLFSRSLTLGAGAAPFIYAGAHAGAASGTAGGLILQSGSTAIIDADFICQGPGNIKVRAGNGSIMGFVAVFDAVASATNPGGHGIVLGQLTSTNWVTGAPLSNITVGFGGHQLWGAGNAGKGLFVGPGCDFGYLSTTPTITGTGGDFQLGVLNATQARGFDETLSIYGVLTNCTWALLATAYGGGGFTGCAHDVAGNAHIVKTN